MNDKYNLIPMESGYENMLVAVNRRNTDLALQADYCVGGVRTLVFEKESHISGYIHHMNQTDGTSIDTNDVIVKKASDLLCEKTPVYLVQDQAKI